MIVFKGSSSFEGNDAFAVRIRKTAGGVIHNIQSVYYKVDGTVRIVWQAIRSCFGAGYWLNDKPWLNDDGWKGL